MRTAGKWMVGISIFLLIGLFLLYLVAVVGAVLCAAVFQHITDTNGDTEPIAIQVGIAVGSPAFYALIAELALLLLGILFWIFGKKKQKTVESL